MTLKEAISHARDVASSTTCEACAQDHLQLAKWLEELEALRKIVNDIRQRQKEMQIPIAGDEVFIS